VNLILDTHTLSEICHRFTRDPFDRLLVAQAVPVHEGMLIATHDPDIARYGVGIVVA
jgi:PIN domain nuclease of toxin-antitoxin system